MGFSAWDAKAPAQYPHNSKYWLRQFNGLIEGTHEDIKLPVKDIVRYADRHFNFINNLEGVSVVPRRYYAGIVPHLDTTKEAVYIETPHVTGENMRDAVKSSDPDIREALGAVARALSEYTDWVEDEEEFGLDDIADPRQWIYGAIEPNQPPHAVLIDTDPHIVRPGFTPLGFGDMSPWDVHYKYD